MRVPQPLLLLVLFLFLYTPIFSQSIDDIISSLSENYGENISDDELASLEELFQTKININDLTEDDCSQFFFLTSFEQQSLLFFINHNKPLYSIYELQFVLGLPHEKAKILAQLCCVKPCSSVLPFSVMLSEGTHVFASTTTVENIDNQKFKEENNFLGNSMKEVVRYRFHSYNSLFVGATFKKDKGEPFSIRDGFDSYSFYFQLKNRKWFSNFVLGDYKVSIGQGLTISQGSFVSSAMNETAGKQSAILSKQSATSEFSFSRGVGITIPIKKLQFTPFLSFRSLDGKLVDSPFPFSIQKTGYHRTESEIASKKQIDYTLCGLHTSLNLNRLRVGMAVLQHSFAKDSNSVHIRNVSLHYAYHKRHFFAYGECAFDKYARCATIHGMQFGLSDEIVFAHSFRYYQADYQSFMSSAISKQSSIGNEIGWNCSLSMQVNSHISLLVTNDLYTFPKNGDSAPTKGDVGKLLLSYSKYGGVYAYYQMSVKSKNDGDEGEFSHKINHKLYVSYPINLKVTLKSSMQFSKRDDDVGRLFYCDVVSKYFLKTTVSLRFAQFHASYDMRLYAWEDDIQYVFANSQYYYSGTYWYVLVKRKCFKNIDVQCKIAQTRYDSEYELPESYELYRNNHKIRCNLLIQITL